MKIFVIISALSFVFAEDSNGIRDSSILITQFSNSESVPNVKIESVPVQAVGPEESYTQPKDKEDTFDWLFTKEVFQSQKDQNIIISPISVKLLMTVLAEIAGQGVQSTTRDELMLVLPGNKTLESAREYFQKVLLSLEAKSETYTLNIGTQALVGQGVHATQKIGGNLEFSYKCNLKEVDFSDTVNVANGINEWVKQITNGKIPTFVDAESLSNSMMILINAIYFRGLWKVPFEKTKSLNFQVGGKMNVTKEFVEQVSEHDYLYSKALNAKIIRLPYEGGKFSMFVLLPFKVDGLNDLIDQLDAKILKQEVDRMDIVEVIVTLPKFKFESAMQLNQIIRSLGINDIFEDTATFHLFTGNKGLKVSKIIQKSGIVVDEKGSEAFAATEIELIDKFGGDPREFNANHPFVFYIEDDKTGAKLFSGVVNDPEY